MHSSEGGSLIKTVWKVIKAIFEPVRKVLEPVGKFVQSIVNFILLAVVYFIPLGLVSIISKTIFKKKFLDISEDKRQKSYWKNKDLGTEEMRRYYRMY